MRLMHYAPIDWLDVVAMRVKCAVSSWVNVTLKDVVVGRKLAFRTGVQFKETMVQQFETIT